MHGTSNLIDLRKDFDKVTEDELKNSFKLLLAFCRTVTEKGILFLDPDSVSVIKSMTFLCLRLYTEVVKDRFGYDLSEELDTE